MESEDEEISDNFEDETEAPRAPDAVFFPTSDDPNKPKPLLEQYHERKLVEESADQKERAYLESRIRAIVSANPKVEIGKPSALQEKLGEMSTDQLKFALQSAEDQIGISNPFGMAKVSMQLMDYGLQQVAGRQFQPEAYEDCQLLGTINRMMPMMTHTYQDPLTCLAKMLQYLVNSQPVAPAPAQPVPAPAPPPGAGVGDLA